MKNLWFSLQKSLDRTTSSIAFIPSLFAVSGLILAFFTVSIEYEPAIIDFKKNIKFLLITSEEDGRLVLGTLVGSIISLMVFSFSMVMIVLSRASSNLSPRILPGLISNKPHQVILGFYLGTILYSLIMIVNFQSDKEYVLPSLGILSSMIFGVTCLCLFIYFIHSISKSIQVESIINNIYKKTLHQMEMHGLAEKQDEIEIPAINNNWEDICLENANYLKLIKIDELLKISVKYDFKVSIQKSIGSFLVVDYPFLKVSSSKNLSEENINKLRACFSFYPDDQVKDHYLFGFKQISEVAIKALSPGINDPGTAIKALDLLSVLFIKRMEINEPLYKIDDAGVVRIIYLPVSLEELIFKNLIPIREYGKGDVLVIIKVLELLKNMIYADRKNEYAETLISTVKSCIQSADLGISNNLDREQINKMLRTIDEKTRNSTSLSYLAVGS